jgi:hypothetical protein
LGDQRRDPSGDFYERHIVFRLLALGAFTPWEKALPQVEIPVHVTNQLGATVAGLTKDDFELWEDGVPQTVSHFSVQEAPLSVGLLPTRYIKEVVTDDRGRCRRHADGTAPGAAIGAVSRWPGP